MFKISSSWQKTQYPNAIAPLSSIKSSLTQKTINLWLQSPNADFAKFITWRTAATLNTPEAMVDIDYKELGESRL